MTNIPVVPDTGDEAADQPDTKLQGYQDDIDTSKRDQFGNEAGSDPTRDTPATPAEWREGMRDTVGDGGESGLPADPDELERQDDFRETVEDRGANSRDAGDDDKGRGADPASWQ